MGPGSVGFVGAVPLCDDRRVAAAVADTSDLPFARHGFAVENVIGERLVLGPFDAAAIRCFALGVIEEVEESPLRLLAAATKGAGIVAVDATDSVGSVVEATGNPFDLVVIVLIVGEGVTPIALIARRHGVFGGVGRNT